MLKGLKIQPDRKRRCQPASYQTESVGVGPPERIPSPSNDLSLTLAPNALSCVAQVPLPHRFFQRSASAATLSSMVCGLWGGASFFGWGAVPCAGFEPRV